MGVKGEGKPPHGGARLSLLAAGMGRDAGVAEEAQISQDFHNLGRSGEGKHLDRGTGFHLCGLGV